MYKQREIILTPFPYSDLAGAKQRPALIISNEKLNKTEDRICCLITSKPTKEGILVNKYEKGKLPFKSWVKPHRIFTISEKIIKKGICKVSKKQHEEVLSFLNNYLIS